jgi:hypothetical protein
MISEEMLENLILGHIAKELKDEIQIGRQVNLAKAIMQALRIHDVVERSEQLSCDTCIFNTHSWSEEYPCATCCSFNKHQAT